MYGQQFSNQGSSAPKWIFFGLLGIILMGFLLGMNIKDATWLNSGIAQAEAERIQVETAHQQATNELQIRRLAAQTEAEIRQIQREQEMLDAQHAHDLQVLNQDIANRQRWADFMINAATILSIGSGVLAALSIFTLVVAKSVAMVRAVPSVKPVVIAPMPTRSVQPAIAKKIPSLAERKAFEPLAASQLDQRMSGILNDLSDNKDDVEMVSRMKAVVNPALVGKIKYNKSPLAGD